MSLLSEVIGAQQAQAQEPRNEQDQRLKVAQFLDKRRQDQQAMQMNAMSMDAAMRKQAQDQQSAVSDKAGMADYLGVMKNQYGPNVSQVGTPGKPAMAPLTFDTVAASILKQKPDMEPQEFAAAMKQFEPQFQQQDKMKLAEFEAKARAQFANKTVDEQVYANALKEGKTTEEAANIAQNFKRSQGIAGAQLTPQGGVTMRPGAVTAQEQQAQAKATGTKTGELDVKKEAAQPKALSTMKELQAATDGLDQFFKQAKDLSGAMTTGAGAYLSGVKGTDAYNLARVVDTIKANIGFDKLQQMRDSSPTGSALGRVTNFEMQTLQNVVASIDPGQGKEQFLQHLDIAKKAVEASMKRVQEAYDETYGDKKQEQAPAANAGGAAPTGKTIDFNDWK